MAGLVHDGAFGFASESGGHREAGAEAVSRKFLA